MSRQRTVNGQVESQRRASRAPQDTRRPTLADVAREAGVSVKTVSRVINDPETVQQAYIDRVSAAIARVGFRRNELARNLRVGGKSSTIGLVIGDVRNPFYSVITRTVDRVARSHATLVFTCNADEDPEREMELVQELCQRRVDGLLVVPTYADHSFCQIEIDMGTPMVFVDRRTTGAEADTVLIDNVRGARQATEYLLSQGHSAIGVIGQDMRIFTMAQRLAGFRSAMDASSCSVDKDLLHFGATTPREAAEVAGFMLGLRHPPTAFLCCTNRATVGVVEELWRRGEYAAVAGFDDVDTASLFPLPVALVVYDAEQLGLRSAELLFRRIAGYRGGPKELTIETRLIVRGSAGNALRRTGDATTRIESHTMDRRGAQVSAYPGS